MRNFGYDFVMRLLATLMLAAACVAIGLVGAAAAEPVRVALVVGNGDYKGGRLVATAADAGLIARSLRGLGFDGVDRTNLDLEGMKQAIQEFVARLQAVGTDSVGLFYYAGHGVQVGGKNYLLPIDFKRDGSVNDVAVNITTVLEAMQKSGNKLNFVIVDAGYGNRFGRSLGSRKSGLAPMRAPAGTVIAFSAAPDKKALKTVGDNSNYSRALVKIMETKGTSLSQLFQLVRMNVMGGSKTQQIPWESKGYKGDFLFAPSE